MVLLHRVDNRLIHGQILEAWAPRLGADAILVVDDALYEDDFQRMLLEGMGQGLLDVRTARAGEGAAIVNGEWKNKRAIVLYRSVALALAALRAGMAIDTLNLGNIHPGGQTIREVNASVHLSAEDEEGLREILSRGVAVEARAVPAEASPDMAALLANASGAAT